MILFGFLLVVLYFRAIFYISRDLLKFVQQQQTLTRILFYFSLLFPGLAILYILNEDNYIYYADYSNYWIKSIKMNQFMDENGFKTLDEIYKTIKHDQYNDFIVLPITLMEKIFGFDFRYFVFSVYLIYAIPSSLLFTNLLMIISGEKKINLLFCPIIILSYIPLLLPLRMGFADIACLVPIGLILNLFFKSQFQEKIESKKFIAIGLLILILVISRRYFTFWFIAFFMINFLLIVVKSIYLKKVSVLRFGIINLSIAGVTSVIILLVFFYPFFELTFLTDYKDLYSGYRKLDWGGHLRSVQYRFGYIFLGLAALGVYSLIAQKKYYFVLYLVLSTVFIFIYFVSYNDFGPQHYYLIIPFVILLILGIINFPKQKFSKYIIGFLLILFGCNFYLSVLSNKSEKLSHSLLIKSNAFKLVRDDYNEIETLVNDIKSNYENGFFTYNLSNSEILHTSIIQNFDLPKRTVSTEGILYSQHVDKRDKFPNELFKADFVLVADPVQLHLKPKDQQLIVFFNDAFLDGKFKNHYKRVKTYNLKNDVKIHLLKKEKGFLPEEIKLIKSHFENLYPDYPNMYDVNMIVPQTKSVKMGKGGKINFEGNNILMDPGSENPTEITFNLDSTKIYKFNFKAGFRSKEYILNNCNLENEAEVNLRIYTNNTIFNHSYLTYKKDSVYNFEIKNASEIKFQVDKGKNKNWCDLFQLSEFKITQK